MVGSQPACFVALEARSAKSSCSRDRIGGKELFTKKNSNGGAQSVANNVVLSTYLGKINFMFSNGTTFNNSM